MILRFISLLLLALSAHLHAADVPLPGTAQFASPYDVEIVIFERYGHDNEEQWPEEPGLPDIDLAAGDLRQPGLQGPDAVLLPDTERQLGPAVYTLEQKGALVHAHQAWRQDVKNRDSNTWYQVGNERLIGLVRISKGRYLHLDTDLLLQPDELEAYRVRLHRRMRSGELHYVDHPKVGILIRTARVETAPVVAPEPETDIPATLPPSDEPEEQPSPSPGSLPRAMPDPT
jgi:hypothetical protein